MEKTLQVLNELVRDGIISRYAIGGAMGAFFYAEPVTTFDLDVFIEIPVSASGLVSLSALYEELQRRGYNAEREFVIIEGVPVQFLTSYSRLVEEALTEAREMTYGSLKTRVLRVEHLIAICLQTGREKDRARVRLLLEQAEVNNDSLKSIMEKHQLMQRWNQWIE